MTAIDVLERGRPAPASFDLSIDVYDGDSLAAADWPSITGPPNFRMYAFQSREFLDVWMNTIGKARRSECYLVVVKDGSHRPVLYLPLAIESQFNVRLLRFMDAGVADYNAPILGTDKGLTRQQFDRLWPKILALLPKFDAIDLQKIPSDVLGQFNPLVHLDCVPYASGGHSIALGTLPGGVNVRPSVKAQRKNLRRRYRDLRTIGQTDFIVNPTAAGKECVLDRLLELKRQKYLRTIGRDFLATPGVTGFYRQITEPRGHARVSHLSALTCNGTVVSAHLGFTGRGRFHYILPAYDTEYRRFEVGHLLLQHLIDRSFDDGLTTFDLGVGDFFYKARWATHRLALYSYEQHISSAGWLYLQMRRAQRFAGTTGVRKWLRDVRSR
jgi:CelD/BcsL family acetyltransferase involved in cellulose biosynthesis